MRDLMQKLQNIRKEHDYELEVVVLDASLPDDASAIDDILKKADAIRKEVSSLRSEVQHLGIQNERFGAAVNQLLCLKRDTDGIGRHILFGMQCVYFSLQDLSKKIVQLGVERGPTAAVSRIAHAQYDSLSLALHSVMNDYIKVEESHKNRCRERIRSQASIRGVEVTDEQLDEMVENGGKGWGELYDKMVSSHRQVTKQTLNEMKDRFMEQLHLRDRMKEFHELSELIAKLPRGQGLLY